MGGVTLGRLVPRTHVDRMTLLQHGSLVLRRCENGTCVEEVNVPLAAMNPWHQAIARKQKQTKSAQTLARKVVLFAALRSHTQEASVSEDPCVQNALSYIPNLGVQDIASTRHLNTPRDSEIVSEVISDFFKCEVHRDQ